MPMSTAVEEEAVNKSLHSTELFLKDIILVVLLLLLLAVLPHVRYKMLYQYYQAANARAAVVF